jgi:hypothetical protein
MKENGASLKASLPTGKDEILAKMISLAEYPLVTGWKSGDQPEYYHG